MGDAPLSLIEFVISLTSERDLNQPVQCDLSEFCCAIQGHTADVGTYLPSQFPSLECKGETKKAKRTKKAK
jgi:hypothetical protein